MIPQDELEGRLRYDVHRRIVQSAADVLYIRSILDADPRGKDIKIISKIENQEVCWAATGTTSTSTTATTTFTTTSAH